MSFNFVPHKGSDVSIMAASDDIQLLLQDHIVKVITMKSSPFIQPLEKDLQEVDLMLVRSLNLSWPCSCIWINNGCESNLYKKACFPQ